MADLRRHSWPIVLAVALAGVAGASALAHQPNPSALPTGLSVAANAESTALYCTGLTDVAGGFAGGVTFLNTTDVARHLSVDVVSNTGAQRVRSIQLGAYASTQVHPDRLVAGSSYGVATVVDGGGVVGEAVTSDRTAQVPCTSTGVTEWYATGFDTLVGSSASLSVYNPTATPAVLDVTTFTAGGFAAPPPFQGIAVGAHQQIALNLGTQIVNTSNIGVRVRVLRGSVDVVGEQRSNGLLSMNAGSTAPATTTWFPEVTTAGRAVAQLRLANPGPQPATVVIKVALARYVVAPLSETVPAFSSREVLLAPNHAIPEAGYATVRLTSNVPIESTLATGTSAGLALSPAPPSANLFLLADFTGRGFDAASVTNTSSRPITVAFVTDVAGRRRNASAPFRLEGYTTRSIRGIWPAGSSRGATLLITSTKPTLLVSATLPTRPVGVTVVSPLYGG